LTTDTSVIFKAQFPRQKAGYPLVTALIRRRLMKANILSLSIIILGLFLATSACATSGQSKGPMAEITFPVEGSHFTIDQKVTVQFGATDVNGVGQMEVTINGQPVYVEPVSPPVNAFVASYVWTPTAAGSYVIQAVAFSVDGQSSEPAQVVVTVDEAVAGATPTISPVEPTPTSTPIPTPTSRPLPPPPPASTSDQLGLKPMVTALVALNVRAGPGTDYPVIGRLTEDQSAEIVGRDGFADWWQIVFTSENSQVGWVVAGGEFSKASNVGAVPTAEIPTPPAAAPPTSPATSDSLKPTIYSFTANRYTIAAGEAVVLNWDLANAQAAYLRYNGLEEGVAAPGSKTVTPDKDTVYTLIARNDAGETTAELTISVSGPAPTPVPVFRDGKLSIIPDQSIDFDQGVVQDSISPATDFYWDGQQKQFRPQGSAVGTLLSSSYGDITLSHCLSASYGQPIDVRGGAVLMTGCYKTNEGRYGKFYVSEWDLAGNLTIEWLTWDYR
jgi:hypothetical protein